MRLFCIPFLFLVSLALGVFAVPRLQEQEVATVFDVNYPFIRVYQTVSGFGLDYDAIWRAFANGQYQAVKYSQALLDKASHEYHDIEKQVSEFRKTMAELIDKAKTIRDELEKRINEMEAEQLEELNSRVTDGDSKLSRRDLDAKGTLDQLSEWFAVELGKAIEDLKKEFGDTLSEGEGERAQDRERVTDAALDKAEGIFVRACTNLVGIPEEEAGVIFKEVRALVRKLILVTGNMIDRHPVLMESLLFAGLSLLIPESWILRPLLSVFGFGPMGPIKGTPAAWMQRRFWGEAVKAGSWFSHLQRAGMKLPIGVGRGIWAGIGAGLGIIAAKFCSN